MRNRDDEKIIFKIGILNCELISNDVTSRLPGYPDLFIEAFKNTEIDFKFNVYNAVSGNLPVDIDECNGYIVTGSYASVNDDDNWIKKLADFIRSCNTQQKKLVGICFGHQLISKALGGVVKKNDLGWNIGLIENTILKQKAWMNPEIACFNMIVSHEDQVVQIPEKTEVLASNERCANFIIQRGNSILGIQGHPEFNNDYCRSLMEKNKSRIPTRNLETGYVSLSGQPDNRTLIQWITNFLMDYEQ